MKTPKVIYSIKKINIATSLFLALTSISFMQTVYAKQPSLTSLVDLDDMNVTSGKIQEDTQRNFKINGSIRAVSNSNDGNYAYVKFRYNGESDEDKPLASGELRRQIALKLRGQDTCNVIYIAWHIYPTQKIAVSVKLNPNKSTHEECRAGGYKNLSPNKIYAKSTIQKGEWHTLEGFIKKDTLYVYADNQLVWNGVLPPQALSLKGSSGIRTDNGDFDVKFYQDKNH